MKALKKVFKAESSLIWILVGTLIFFAIAEPAFFSFNNITNIFKNASYMGLMVLGVTWVIAIGEMDCSFPDVAACGSMVFAWLACNGYSIELSIVIAVLVGIACGLITSILVVKFKFNSLITTIAIAVVARSIAAALNGGMPLNAPVIKSSAFYSFINSNIFGLPMIFVIVIGIYLILYLIQEKTRYGQYIYALGENRQAVKETGVKCNYVIASTFVLSALFAALAGIFMVFVIYGSGQPKMGSSFFLDGFTVVFLGAMVLKLGKPNVVGTFLGGIMLAMIVNGLTLMGASFATSQIIKGLLLVAGIIMVAFGQKKRRGKVGVLKYE